MNNHDQDSACDSLEQQLASIAPAQADTEFLDALKAIPNIASLPQPSHRRTFTISVAACAAAALLILAFLLSRSTPPPSDAEFVALPHPFLTTQSTKKIDRIILSASDEGIFISPSGIPLQRTRYELIDIHTLPKSRDGTSIQVSNPVTHIDYRPVNFY